MIYYANELYHYGVKGQHWGERNYQNEDGSYTTQGQSENNGHGRYSSAHQINNSLPTSLKLTEKQKKYLKIGLAVTGAVLLTYGTYKLYNNSQINFIRTDGDAGIVDPNNLLQRTLTSGKLSEALKDVNPSNEKDHCQQNSVAACLRYMGIDAKTKAGAWDTTTGAIVAKCFKGDDSIKVREPKVTFANAEEASSWIIKRLRPENGSCGTISLPLALSNDGSGHAIMWCMEDGTIKYSDPFARTKDGFAIVEDASSYFGSIYSTSANPTISRIDNLEINIEEFNNYFTK